MYSSTLNNNTQVDEWKNITVFQLFKTRLSSAMKFDSGDLLIKVSLTCYGRTGIEYHNGTVIMISHGDEEGNIGLCSDFTGEGGEMFYLMIDIMRNTYSLGRSGKVLSIESHDESLLHRFMRIDLEERGHEFVLWNN